MFTIRFRNREPVRFQVHDAKPNFPHLDEPFTFTADGYELELVRKQFTNIPYKNGDTCTWNGDLAEFIFRNLITTFE